MLRAYEVPELKQPKMSKFAILYSNVNSSVYLFKPNKKIPTQKPKHMGQWKSSPKKPLAGLIELKIEP